VSFGPPHPLAKFVVFLVKDKGGSDASGSEVRGDPVEPRIFDERR
jgi:hypothetical protein